MSMILTLAASVLFSLAGDGHLGMVKAVDATENLFYGSSSFESLTSTQLGKSSVFQLKVQYDIGPDEIQNVIPVFSFYPESTSTLVRIESGSIDTLTRGDIGVITNEIIADSRLSSQNVFVSVYFIGTDSLGNYYESGWIDSIVMDVGRQSVPLVPPISDDEEAVLQSLPPLKQLRAGVAPEDITCKEGFVVAIKTSNGSPSCIRPETKAKLLERGWVK